MKKISDTQRKVTDELRLTLSTQHQGVLANLKQKNRELQGEICDLRGEVSCREPHTPLKDEEFIYRGNYPICIGGGKIVNEDFLKYVANVGLKVILAEIPDDVPKNICSSRKYTRAYVRTVRSAEDFYKDLICMSCKVSAMMDSGALEDPENRWCVLKISNIGINF